MKNERSLLLLLYLLEPRGRFLDCRLWLNGHTSCAKHNLRVPLISGIICGNFGCQKNDMVHCMGARNASCYQQHVDDGYSVLAMMDLDNSLIDDGSIIDNDLLRFKEGIEIT